MVRADIVAEEALKATSGEPGRAVNIGFVGNITSRLKDKGFSVKATDFDPKVVGERIKGVDILDGSEKNRSLIRESDVAVVTGMTLATRTLEGLIEMCREFDTCMVVFAQTAPSLASKYPEFGVDAVVREPFPFYDYHGQSKIVVNRK